MSILSDLYVGAWAFVLICGTAVGAVLGGRRAVCWARNRRRP